MLLSKACIYGLRSSLFLATYESGTYVSIKEISETLDISFHFLTKILQQLTGAGILESQKGPNGGVRLSKPSSELCLFIIVEAIDGTEIFTECVLGLKGCGTQKPCPMHEKWGKKRDDIQEMLKSTTLLELVEKGKAGNLRITSKGDFEWQ
ncbi:MAG: Rrf2 family transcriptional regulator [Balneolaceae bacterium]|nr:Rrf2 family transcriptional regulator [Balneolaceae bacterium]